MRWNVEDDGRAPCCGLQGVLHLQAILPSEAHIQDEAGQAIWAWAPQELTGRGESFNLHPERADEAG
jgi:hypothetical protein